MHCSRFAGRIESSSTLNSQSTGEPKQNIGCATSMLALATERGQLNQQICPKRLNAAQHKKHASDPFKRKLKGEGPNLGVPLWILDSCSAENSVEQTEGPSGRMFEFGRQALREGPLRRINFAERINKNFFELAA